MQRGRDLVVVIVGRTEESHRKSGRRRGAANVAKSTPRRASTSPTATSLSFATTTTSPATARLTGTSLAPKRW